VSKAKNCSDLITVELTEQISVLTNIPKDNHAALRAGFSGLPANPRWNISKFRAWKTGRQWREAVKQGKMRVRSADSMLVTATESETEEANPSDRSKSTQPKTFKFAFGRHKFQIPLATSVR
jgi:hypothetical protein